MTEQEVINGNILIAEFMGLKPDEIFAEVDKERKEKGLFIGSPMYEKDGCVTNLRYDFSWDWLMPVVEKIESLGHPVYIHSNCCEIYEKANINKGWSIGSYQQTKIEATFDAIISCIKKDKQ